MTDQRTPPHDIGYIPAPFPADEAARLEVVSRLMSHDFDLSKLEPLVAQVAQIFDVPMAAATVLDADWQHFAAKVGVDMEKSSRAVAFCGYTISHDRPFLVHDAQKDERFAGNPFVVRDPSIRFYAGARIMVAGMPIGALCALGQSAQNDVDLSSIDHLANLAAAASIILNEQLASRA